MRTQKVTTKYCKRDKRNYTKGTNEYWSDIIFKQRAAKIYEEMSLVADKYSENLFVSFWMMNFFIRPAHLNVKIVYTF
jgi:hypothetical protein